MKPQYFFDCCGSVWSGRLFSCLPANSNMVLIGNIEGDDMKINSKEFYLHNKRIRGFNLHQYLTEEMDKERWQHLLQIIRDDINSGGEYFGSEIGQEFKLDQWQQALNSVDNLTEGKRILLDINA
jgi:hypothetical protein